MAEVLLRHHAGLRGLDLVVSSAGFWVEGEPASREAVTVMAERGHDLSTHRSRVVTAELARSHDLVLALERELARRVLTLVDEAGFVARVHTLGGLAAGLAGCPAVSGDPRARARAVAARRRTGDLLGRGDDEVPDPHGQSLERHRRTLERIEELVIAVLDGLHGPGGGDGGPSVD